MLSLLINWFLFSLIKDYLSRSAQGTQSFFSVISEYSNGRREWARELFSGGLIWPGETGWGGSGREWWVSALRSRLRHIGPGHASRWPAGPVRYVFFQGFK